MTYVPASNERGRPSLRDYAIVTQAGVNPDFEYLSIQGNFFRINGPVADPNFKYSGGSDQMFEVIFDDSDRIVMRPFDKITREYSRVGIRPINPTGGYNHPAIRLSVMGGFGYFDSDRVKHVPTLGEHSQVTIFTGGAAQALISPGFEQPLITEIRLCVPASEPNGIYLGFDSTVTAATGFWLERGQVEWLEYTGGLWAVNNGSSNVRLTIAKLRPGL